jgi:hypothetical protein
VSEALFGVDHRQPEVIFALLPSWRQSARNTNQWFLAEAANKQWLPAAINYDALRNVLASSRRDSPPSAPCGAIGYQPLDEVQIAALAGDSRAPRSSQVGRNVRQ